MLYIFYEHYGNGIFQISAEDYIRLEGGNLLKIDVVPGADLRKVGHATIDDSIITPGTSLGRVIEGHGAEAGLGGLLSCHQLIAVAQGNHDPGLVRRPGDDPLYRFVQSNLPALSISKGLGVRCHCRNAHKKYRAY